MPAPARPKFDEECIVTRTSHAGAGYCRDMLKEDWGTLNLSLKRHLISNDGNDKIME